MANEVEVKITASTEALAQGLNQAESKVQATADSINRIADTIKTAFDGVRTSLQNIDVSLNIDMSAVQQSLNQATNTIRTRLQTISDDAVIKLKIDPANLQAEMTSVENTLRTRLSALPVQNLSFDIDLNAVKQKLNQLNAQQTKYKLKLDTANLNAEIAIVKNKITTAFANGIKARITPQLLSADVSVIRTQLQGIANKTYKAKLGIDLTYLNNQINLARTMLNGVSTGLNINIDATSNLLRASLDRLKVSIDLLRNQMGSGSGGGSGGPAGGGGGGSGIGGGMLASFGGNILANAVSNLTSQLSQLFSEALRNAREIENMSRLANTTTQEFQEWAFASKSVGVSQEKLGDIMKDVNDKFGDFMQTGGGEMADFFEKIAPKVGVTAKEFQGLSGPQILGKYYDTLQKANVSQAEMTFYMESIANDATLLAPLLANNGEKLKEMAKQAHDLGIILTDEAIQATKEFQGALGLIGSTIKGVVGNILADLAPALKGMADNFLTYMVDSKESVDGAITAIITIFESLGGICSSIVTLIGDLWSDLTQDIGDGAVEQITFMDMVGAVFKSLATIAVGLKVGIEIAFAGIRAIVTTVCEAIKVTITAVLNTFDGFRDTIRYGLDYLSAKFRTFGNVVESVLRFDFKGAKVAWENGLSDISNLTDQYASKMQNRFDDIKASWSNGFANSTTAWEKMGEASVKSATAGIGILKPMYLQSAQPEKKKTPPPSAPKVTTFNSSRGIGTGTKDEAKKSDKKDKEAKYDPTSYADLRIKSKEAYAGGSAHQGLLDLAGVIQDKFQITRFTAFNDSYHKGTSSQHAKGLALDFTLQNPDTSAKVTNDIRAMLAKNGINAQVLDEYKNPSRRATGGHIHVGFRSKTDADNYLALTKGNKIAEPKKSKSSSDSQYESYLREQQQAEKKAQKDAASLRHKYANDEKKIALDLEQSLKDIRESSKLSEAEKAAFKVQAEQEASEKVKAIQLKVVESKKRDAEEEIQSLLDISQRAFEQEMVNIQALFDARRISNVEKFKLEQQAEDHLYGIKRYGLEKRLDLEMKYVEQSGKDDGLKSVKNSIVQFDHEKSIKDKGKPKALNDAELADFEKKFGGLTSRMSSLWDQGMQAMMNGTLTWKSAMSAIFSELAMEFVQKMITAPLKEYMIGLAQRLAIKMGFITAETGAEVAGQTAQTGAVIAGETAKTSATGVGTFARLAMRSFEAVKSIMISAWQAMANALASVPPPWNIALGGLAFAGVAALAGKVASARGGYDIPAGVNPLTQLHEEEMVLPKQHANTIRALGRANLNGDSGSGFGMPSTSTQGVTNININAVDAKSVKRLLVSNGSAVAQGLQKHARNFGKK